MIRKGTSVSHPRWRNCHDRRHSASHDRSQAQRDQGAGGQRAASLSRATNETTRGMRAFLLLLLVAATLSDALSTLNGRVDEEHNAIVVEGMWLV